MNLFDIVKRKDAGFDSTKIFPEFLKGAHGKMRGVHFEKNSSLTIFHANELSCLRVCPRELGWEWFVSSPGVSRITITAKILESGDEVLLGEAKSQFNNPAQKLFLNWPLAVASPTEYDLIIKNEGDASGFLSIGTTWSSRNYLLSTLKGNGIEIGPGSNPGVISSPDINVKYVENVSAEQWFAQYGTEADSDRLTALWDRYIISSAENLELVEDGSLDFIFSSHVFEHLVNPLGVLDNWHRKLKVGGVAVGVVPDCRYSFDCRQVPSNRAEIDIEYKVGGFTLGIEHYQKWVRWTARNGNADSLMRLKYSVHAKYYTPDSFLALVETSSGKLAWSRRFVQTCVNAKDFGFSLKK